MTYKSIAFLLPLLATSLIGEQMNASVIVSQLLTSTRITVVVGASKDSATVPKGSAEPVELTIECDGEDVVVEISSGGSPWGSVTSCSKVNVL